LGQELILVNYEHQPSNSPYRAAHAIFVPKGVEQAQPAPARCPRFSAEDRCHCVLLTTTE
jgi:hypothetical protein